MGEESPAPDDRLDGNDPLEEVLQFLDPLTRRKFLRQIALTGVALTASQYISLAAFGATPADEATANAAAPQADAIDMSIKINGETHALRLDPRTTLLDALRERLNLTGTKKGCDHGQCGACTVLVNGRRINSCLALAISYQGDEITTIEGLAQGGQLHPVQAAFVKHDGFQCGYCTPGQICSAVACLSEGHAKSDEEVRQWMSGNICRCGAYTNIVAAIREVQQNKAAASASADSPQTA